MKEKTSHINILIISFLIFITNVYGAETICTKDFLVLDVGSSTTKGTLYTKDIYKNNKITSKKTFNINYPYQACLSDSGGKSLPKKCIDGGKQVMQNIQKHFGIKCNNNCFAAVTGWARYIDNQDEWFKEISKTGIKAMIVSQDYEGNLKLSAIKKAYSNKDVIAFDIGGGSFQLVWEDENGQIQNYNSLYGTDNFTHDIQDALFSERSKVCIKARNNLHLLRNSKASLAEIKSAEETEKKLCSGQCSITFSESDLQNAISYADDKIGRFIVADTRLQDFVKKNNPTVYADTLLFNLGIRKQLGVNKDVITIDDVYKIMTSVSGMHYIQIKSKYPNLPDICVNTTQPAMLILYTIMKSLGINQMTTIQTDYMEAFLEENL